MKKRDYILIAAILALALIMLTAWMLTRKTGGYVVVRVDGEEVARYDLHKDGEYALNGGSNVLRIADGKAFMIEADCPDQVCIGQGAKSFQGETITCLPNKLTVTVYGEEGEVELEAH